MVPILSLFFIQLVPLSVHLLSRRGIYQWRVLYFVGLNLLLLPFASFNTSQSNVIGLVQYLNHEPEIHKVIGIDSTLIMFPQAYMLRNIETGLIRLSEIDEIDETNCDEVIAVRQDIVASIPQLHEDFKKIKVFSPGILEALIIRMNPKRNTRRGGIELYSPIHCG